MALFLATYAMLGLFFYAMFFVGAQADTRQNTGDYLADWHRRHAPTDSASFHSDTSKQGVPYRGQ